MGNNQSEQQTQSVKSVSQTNKKSVANISQVTFTEGKLRCGGSQPAVNICTNKNCRSSAMYCDDPFCQLCRQNHPKCANVKVSVVGTLLNNRVQMQKRLVGKMEEEEMGMFKLFQERERMVALGLFQKGFDTKFSQLVQSIQLGTLLPDNFTGRVAESFCWKLRQANAQLADLEADTLKQWKRSMEKMSGMMLRAKAKVLNNYIDKIKLVEKQQGMSTLQKNNISRVEEKFQLESKIVEKEMEREHRFLYQALDYPKKSKLLYRGSQQAFSAHKFHSLCDSYPHTLTIVKTQYNKIIGGFTPLLWNQKVGSCYDMSGQTFLFSITDLQKMSLNTAKKAIHCDRLQGPIFGQGPDLSIANQCDKNEESSATFPYSFNNEEKTYKYNLEGWQAFCGNPKGRTFQVKEYEVFKIMW